MGEFDSLGVVHLFTFLQLCDLLGVLVWVLLQRHTWLISCFVGFSYQEPAPVLASMVGRAGWICGGDGVLLADDGVVLTSCRPQMDEVS